MHHMSSIVKCADMKWLCFVLAWSLLTLHATTSASEFPGFSTGLCEDLN